MQRLHKTIIVLACIMLSVLLLSLSIDSLGEVPSLWELKAPDLPELNPEMPNMTATPNPETTKLEKPDISLGDAEPLFRVIGATGTQYLRIMAYDKYSSGLWGSSPSDPVSYLGELIWPDIFVNSSLVRMSFSVEPLTDLGEYLPTAPNTISLNLTDLVTYYGDEMVFSCEAGVDAYNLTYLKYSYSDDLLSVSDVAYLPEYLEVPTELDEGLQSLAEEIAGNASTPYEQLLVLEDYLKTHYDYNLTGLDAPPGTDPLEFFLYESGEGVCTDFNTALTMLARSLNISARLVGGYYIDPFALVQDVFPLQAHAFTEVPFEGLGWIIFDATPGSDLLSLIESLGGVNVTDVLPDHSFDGDTEVPVEGDVPAEGDEVFTIFGATGSSYLRDGVGDYYNGSWYMRDSYAIPYTGQYVASVITGYSGYGEYHYYVEPSQAIGGFIPSPLHPLQLNVEWDITFYPEHGLFRVDEPLAIGYEVQSEVYTFNASTLDDATPYNSTLYKQVPEKLRNKILPLAEQVTRNQESPYLKVKALENYLKNQYSYNLSYTRSPVNVDPVEWFLFHERQGVCTNFNTALTLLARSLGIPARLATGYLVNPESEVQTVKATQAHAYAEVLFDDLGWIVFDATPMGGAEEPPEPPGRTPTNATITYQDDYVIVGSSFTVAGIVVDDQGEDVTGLDVLVYLKKDKSEPGVLAGRGVVTDGLFNVTCVFPMGLPGGEYMVDAHALGNEIYLGSWSDPPITSYTETEFISDTPEKVVTGKTFNITGTLVEKQTAKGLPNTPCTVSTGFETLSAVTDKNGRINVEAEYTEPGAFSIEMRYGGEDYRLEALTVTFIESIPLILTPTADIRLIRGENSLIGGTVHADEIPGELETITLSLESQEISTVTNERGEFFIVYRVHGDHELGSLPLHFTLHSGQQQVQAEATIVARPQIDYASRQTVEAGKQHPVRVMLVDDRGQPMEGRPVTLRYRCGDITGNQTVHTDNIGEADFTFKLTDPEETTLTMTVTYHGETYYTAASASTSLTVVTPTQFPILQAAAAALGLAGVGALVYLQKTRSAEATEEQPASVAEAETRSTRLSIALPQIRAPFPNVWGVNEELELLIRLTSVEGDPIMNAPLNMVIDGTPQQVTTSGTGEASTTTSIDSIKDLKVSVNYSPEGLHTELDIRIVDYRDEIISLFNEKFSEAQKRFKAVKDNYTARELLGYLKTQTPEETHVPLGEMIFIFEEANYSLHPIARSSYEGFYLAKTAFEEELNGETS
ncbi:hypothetical protein JXL21_12980 [Candidatus Bathyarchaeota archaeon]|nr:hypothetical protein [Candidatus Bathyarchaeota archaeon]